MTRRIYLHVGPPKTGTTSLQMALQEAELPGLAYVGTRQPRSHYPDSKIRLLTRLAGGDKLTTDESAELRSAFDEPLRVGQALIVSEEMLTVDKTEASIRARISRAIEYFREELGLSVRVILTLRNPIDAIPSYYQEIFQSLPENMAYDFSIFARDGRVFCYDYAALIDHVRSCGAEINVIEFERLTSEGVPLTAVLGADCGTNVVLRLGKANQGNKSISGRRLPSITLAHRLRDSRLRQYLHRSGISRLPGWRAMTHILGQVVIRRENEQELIMPPDIIRHYTNSFIQARAINSAADRFGT